MRKIGIFICYCDYNPVPIELEVADGLQDVVHVGDYKDLCEDPSLEVVKDTVEEKKLDGVVITSCLPAVHERAFQSTLGLGPNRLEIINIKMPDDEERAVRRTKERIIEAIERLHLKASIPVETLPITRRALVIGGGVAGIHVALDIADGGYEVFLVEKTPSIGGHMVQLSEVFPTLDCPQCILTPKMVQVNQHPNIKIMVYSEVEEVEGHVGNFTVNIKTKAHYVNWDLCTGCGLCQEKCPTEVPSEVERWLPFGLRKAIYIPFAQAVPNKPVIDGEHCLKITKDRCGACERLCPQEAVDYSQRDTFTEVQVGAIVVATGYELYPKEAIGEYEEDPDILDPLQFERILCPSGPTDGAVIRPSDGKVPKEVVFVECCGSRDPEHHLPYCSRVCCMYACKMGMLYKHAVPDGQAYIFYIDVRTDGKMYEEFYQRGQEEDGLIYLRGRVSKVFREDDKIMVWGADTLTGRRIEIAADLVVLAMAMVPRPEAKELAEKLGILTDEYGFFLEAHPRLKPLESNVPGIYLAGACQSPKDIPECVAQAGGCASKVLSLFSREAIAA